MQTRPAPEAATLIGQGKVEELAAAVISGEADVVIFDHDLTPTQQRNLEKALDSKVIDRTQLILDIFASRARTREGRLQVELAQLNYLLPRLAGRGVQMSRLGGGIGTRGPGETQLETDRRRIAKRIKKIEDELEGVRAGRALHRRRRSAVPLATLALAGYTNAGKSTLFNRLTRAGVLADAKMFATLDPTVRPLVLPSRRRVLMSDTVGFIRNLPTTLVKAFRATLEEVNEAALILHVVDASSPAAAEHTAHVLEGAGRDRRRRSSADPGAEQGGPPRRRRCRCRHASSAACSPDSAPPTASAIPAPPSSPAKCAPSRSPPSPAPASTRLLAAIDEVLPLDPVVRTTLDLDAGDGATLALLHEFGRVLETRYHGDRVEVEVEVPESLERRLRQRYR